MERMILGRDIFSRVIYGIRVSLLCGLAAVAISLAIGGVLGALAGYYGGAVDNIIMRFMDILLAIPSLLLAISLVAALGGGIGNMLLAIGLSSMPTYCRTLRGEILRIRGTDFVEAAKSAGAKDSWIIIRHIVPNCLAPLIVRVTMGVASAILFCSSLSFIGLGVAAPTPEWGAMLSSAVNSSVPIRICALSPASPSCDGVCTEYDGRWAARCFGSEDEDLIGRTA